MTRTVRRKNSIIHADYVGRFSWSAPKVRAEIARLHRDGLWQTDPKGFRLSHNRAFRGRHRQILVRFFRHGDLTEDSPVLPKMIRDVYPVHYW
jgi:hypothetical protein